MKRKKFFILQIKKVDASGVHVEAVNTKTNKVFETFLRTESDVDVDNNAVHQLRISAD